MQGPGKRFDGSAVRESEPLCLQLAGVGRIDVTNFALSTLGMVSRILVSRAAGAP
jgi:hypothetical protein